MVICVDKPLGWTSADVVRKLKVAMLRAGYPKRVKIGHAGTLDPLATGVLLICTEKDTKRVDSLQAEQKEYIFTVELGATTPSFDLEHPVDERYPWEQITTEAIEAALAAWIGPMEQVPPIYSAKSIDGKRAYEYARQGQEVELKKANVEIYEAELLHFEPPYAEVRVVCSKGTYVRSLARDLGLDLSSGGHLTALRRTKSGGFLATEGLSIEEAADLLVTNLPIE